MDAIPRTERVRRRFRGRIPSGVLALQECHLEKAVPFAQSSPVVAGGRVYLTGCEGDQLLTICLDATTGDRLWQREIRRKTQQIFRANDSASAHSGRR